MRILVYTTQVRFPGGHENLALGLATQLHALGQDVFLLTHYSEDAQFAGIDCAPRQVPPELRASSLGVPVRPSFASVLSAAWRFRRLIRALGVNVVEVSGRGPGCVACLATMGLRVRVIVGIHAVFQRAGRVDMSRILWTLISRICGHVRFYGVSTAATNAWSSYCGFEADRMATIPNCIDAAFFESVGSRTNRCLREELGCSPDERVLLCAGRLMRLKAPDVVLEACAPLLEPYRLRLVFVGRVDPELGDGAAMLALKERVASSNNKHRVHFLGARQDMPEIMAAADVLVHAPRQEAFGLVLAEAMAMGVPVVATAVGGIPEVVDQTHAVLVPPDDVMALRDALEKCLQWSPTQRDTFVQVGRERVMRFHPRTRAVAMLELFRSLVR